VKIEKVIGSLPAQLEADTIYAVRAGSGFNLFFSNSDGDTAYPVNVGGAGAGNAISGRRITNTDTATNVNTASLTEIPLNGTSEFFGAGGDFSPSGNGIRGNFDGTVLASGNIYNGVNGAARNALACEYLVGSTSLGIRYNTSYVRRANGHNESSCVLSGIFINVTDGDIITIGGIQEGNTGIVSMGTAGRSFLQLLRLV